MEIDSYLSGVFLVIGSDVLAVLGLLAVRRVFHAKDLISSHDVGGYLLSVVGTMYAVIVGLIVVDSIARFQEARQMAEKEVNSLANLILLSNRLPREKRDAIRRLAFAYVDRVVDEEWPALERGRHSPEARRAAVRLIDAVCDFEPKTQSEQALYAAEVETVCDFWDSRRSRTVTATHGVPPLEWFVLIVGGVITVAFTYFFKLQHLRIQVIMTSLVATIIALNLFLVLMFGYPFSGELKVESEGFKVVRAIVELQPDPS